MANIVLTSNGTLGDHRPFIGLAAALQARGHRCTLVINPAMLSLARDHGIDALDNGWDALDADQAMRAAASWNHLQPRDIDPDLNALALRAYLAASPPLLKACNDADLIIAAPQMYPAALAVASRRRIPCVSLLLSAMLLEQSRQTDPQRLQSDRAELYSALCAALGATPPSVSESRDWWPPQHGVLAVSEQFYPLPEALRHRITTVGFLHFEDAASQDWRPDAALESFIRTHGAPLVLTYSSLPVDAPAHVVEVHARAAALLDRPLIIQRGWAGLDVEQLPDDIDRSRICVVDYLPHDWLFAQAAAVIHHGGIGTTACALRQACPMLIEPYGNDQFGNARQAVLLGVAAAMHPQLLTARGVAQVLERKVLSAEFRRNADAVARRLSQEQPIVAVVNAIERLLFPIAAAAA